MTDEQKRGESQKYYYKLNPGYIYAHNNGMNHHANQSCIH